MTTQIYEKELLKNVLTAIENHGGRVCLTSVILTGSFGRDEPTYVFSEDGGFALKSDVEIALVYPKASLKKAVSKLIAEVSGEFEEDLNLMAIHEKRVRKAYNYNMSFKTPKYKTLFTYDLFNGSKTIWGEDLIGAKKVSLSEVDLYEAKKLIGNRIGELIYLQSTADNAERKQELAMQWKAKLMLAMASAWLICEGLYVSSYRGQNRILEQNKKAVNSIFGEDFFEVYNKAFSYLRNNGMPYMVEDETLRGFVKQANGYLVNKNIGRPRIMTVSRLVKSCLRYARSGMHYGLFGFADNILQALIDGFSAGTEDTDAAAQAWHSVLY